MQNRKGPQNSVVESEVMSLVGWPTPPQRMAIMTRRLIGHTIGMCSPPDHAMRLATVFSAG
jgi:hypothetical protein